MSSGYGMLAITSSGVLNLPPDMVCCCGFTWCECCLLWLICIFLLLLRWIRPRLICWYRRWRIPLACLALLSAYSSMVTLLLLFCVAILINVVVVFVGLSFDFFFVSVELVVDLFFYIVVSIFHWICYFCLWFLWWLLRWILFFWSCSRCWFVRWYHHWPILVVAVLTILSSALAGLIW